MLLGIFGILISITCLGAAVNKTVITYNAGLYESIGLGAVPSPLDREARRDAIISQLKSNPDYEADVVCLQEIFFGEDVNAVVEGLTSEYPFTFSNLHDRSGNVRLSGRDRTPACGNGNSQRVIFSLFLACVEANCNNVTDIINGSRCIAANCLLRFAGLSQECSRCVLAAAPDVDNVRRGCFFPTRLLPLRFRNMNEPGLVLLSKTRISGAQSIDYHPKSKEFSGIEHGYLQAQIDGIGQVVCTHATPYPDLGFYPEIGIMLREGIRSYVEQGAAELTQLVTKFGSVSPILLLGDFNVGEAVGDDVNASQPANYQIMTSVFGTESLQQCTFCDAPETAYNGMTLREVIDHVFFKGFTPLSTERIFDSVNVSGLPLSDHFGVKQTLTLSN